MIQPYLPIAVVLPNWKFSKSTYPWIFRVLLKDLLQVVVLLPDGVGKPGGPFSDQKLPLSESVVLAAENPGLEFNGSGKLKES